MHKDGIAFLQRCRQRTLELIAHYQAPEDEAAFHSWIVAVTNPQVSGERIQKSRGTYQAEIIVDYMIEYRRRRESKVQALQREVDRLDMVISGEVEFMNSMRALAWCRESWTSAGRTKDGLRTTPQKCGVLFGG